MDRLISEKSVMEVIYGCDWFIDEEHTEVIKERIKAIPSEPKTAQWIHTEECDEEWQYRCSKCNMPSKSSSHRYCSNCGSYMYGLRGEQHG